jgi:hypothetical protein
MLTPLSAICGTDLIRQLARSHSENFIFITNIHIQQARKASISPNSSRFFALFALPHRPPGSNKQAPHETN